MSTAHIPLPKIAVRSLTKRFDGASINALEGINLDIAENEFVTFVGASGCGKSTLLRLVAGLETPTTGEIRLDGTKIVGAGADRGVVFQSYTLFPWLNVRQNICFGLREKGMKLSEQREISDRFIAQVGLRGFEDHFPKQLSGGMQQRVAIARALANDPKILLLDEPFGALDALTREELSLELSGLWQDLGRTAFLITHDIEEAILLSDRVLVMSPRPGRLRADFEIDLPRPRNADTPRLARFQELKQAIRDIIFDRRA